MGKSELKKYLLRAKAIILSFVILGVFAKHEDTVLAANESSYINNVKYEDDLMNVELVKMSEISELLPEEKDISVVDVRTGIAFNIKIFSKGAHADIMPSTKADTELIFMTRDGIYSWEARPIWVFVDDRVFAAAMHGKPHDTNFGYTESGLNGHLCLHFQDTITNNKIYQQDLRNAVDEAYEYLYIKNVIKIAKENISLTFE